MLAQQILAEAQRRTIPLCYFDGTSCLEMSSFIILATGNEIHPYEVLSTILFIYINKAERSVKIVG